MKTTDEVFVDAVRDELNGTPNASHPVQFMQVSPDVWVDACTLCGALVVDRDLHRKNHDEHNKVHDGIETQARRYVPAPRYG